MQSYPADKVTHVWRDICIRYERTGVNDKLLRLKFTMLQAQGAPVPKLKFSAACCRALVQFGKYAAEKFLGAGDRCTLMKRGASVLLEVYACLRTGGLQLEERLTEFAEICVELENMKPKVWRVKPKLHPCMELAMTHAAPSASWCYKDEDFGGKIARLSKGRAGIQGPGAESKVILERFCGNQPLPIA